MDEKLLGLLIPSAVTLLVLVITKFAERRKTAAESTSSEAGAISTLAESAKNIVKTYSDEIVKPLQDRIDSLESQLAVVEEERHQERVRFTSDIEEMKTQIGKFQHEIFFLRGELRRADSSLEFILSITKDAFPKEAEKALRIRRGQL